MNPLSNPAAVVVFAVLVALGGGLRAADRGRETLADLTVRVFYATDGDPAAAGPRAAAPTAESVARLRAHEKLDFAHYRVLGQDTRSLYRSYENWAEPIRGSEEILCRFEISKRLSDTALRIDFELWISRKKTLKSNVRLATDKPLLILGPAWRGGRLIISVEMSPKPGA
jgi:hypothetical protein